MVVFVTVITEEILDLLAFLSHGALGITFHSQVGIFLLLLLTVFLLLFPGLLGLFEKLFRAVQHFGLVGLILSLQSLLVSLIVSRIGIYLQKRFPFWAL